MSGHAVPFHCPYCGGEELRPHEDTHGAWECRECLRAFSVKLIGLLPPPAAPTAPTAPAAPARPEGQGRP